MPYVATGGHVWVPGPALAGFCYPPKARQIYLVWPVPWGQVDVRGLCRAGYTLHLAVVGELAPETWEQES